VPAIRAGLDMGATAIEMDLQFAADSTPMVFRDRTLERMAGVNGTIRNQDLRELGGYDVGFRFGDRFRGLRLLTLEEALDQIPPGMEIHLDIKDFAPVNAKHLRGMLAILKRRGVIDRCLITSTSEADLATLGSTDRDVRRGLRTADARSESVDRAVSLGCGSLHPEAGSTRRPLVEVCHERGIKIYPHCVNDSRSMRGLVEIGVDGVSTDYPDRINDQQEAGLRGRRRPAARASRRGAAAPPQTEAPPEEPIFEEAGDTGASPPEATLLPMVGIAGDGPPPAATPEAGPGKQASMAPAAASAASLAAERKRRRGRRGGKREQARRARRTSPGGAQEKGPAPQAGNLEPTEINPLEVADDDEAGPLELLPDVSAMVAGNGGTAVADGADAAKPVPADGRKRRRRGRRGGKRVQARRQKTDGSGGGSES
jgi:glycerophosphoryl diester phosphodiesterase